MLHMLGNVVNRDVLRERPAPTTSDNPDGANGLGPVVAEPVRSRRRERDYVAGAEDELVEADNHSKRPLEDVTELVAVVAHEALRRARRAAGLVRRLDELHVLVRPEHESFPSDTGVQGD